MRHAGKDVVIWTQGRSPRTWRASGLCQTRQCWSSKRVKFCTLSWIRMVLNRNRTHEICPWLGEAGERLHLSASVISSVKRGEPSCTGRREDSVRPREAADARLARILAGTCCYRHGCFTINSIISPRHSVHLGMPVQQLHRLPATRLGKNSYR